MAKATTAKAKSSKENSEEKSAPKTAPVTKTDPKRDGNVMGIDNLVLLVSAFASFSGTMGAVLEDGKVDWGDIGQVTNLFTHMKAFSAIDYSELLPEASDLSEGETKRLLLVFEDKFDLKNDTLEGKIEEGLGMVKNAVDAILFFINMGSKVKPA